jgi:hypothetical protein
MDISMLTGLQFLFPQNLFRILSISLKAHET